MCVCGGGGCLTGVEWQQHSYLWAGLGWGQKPNREGWHQSFAQVPPNRPCECNTHAQLTASVAILLSHPETVPSSRCQALYSRIPAESVGWWSILETLGCYETWGRVTETDNYFPEATQRGRGSGGDGFPPPTLCHSFFAQSVHRRAWFAQMCERNAKDVPAL